MAIDKVWEELHSTVEWGAYPTEYIIRFVARNFYKVPDRKEVKILDFGAGGGAHTWYLAREGFDTYAFDGAPSAVKKIDEKLKREGLNASLLCADGVDISYENDFFDAVIDNVCIYTNKVEDIKKMYDKVYGILKPGGKFLSAAFGKKTTGYGSGTEVEKDTFVDMTEGNLVGRGLTHFYDEESFRSMLAGCGFKDIVIEKDTYTDRGSVVEILVAMTSK